jgi:hypothetical protein
VKRLQKHPLENVVAKRFYLSSLLGELTGRHQRDGTTELAKAKTTLDMLCFVLDWIDFQVNFISYNKALIKDKRSGHIVPISSSMFTSFSNEKSEKSKRPVFMALAFSKKN